jgi:hypothetical protein
LDQIDSQDVPRLGVCSNTPPGQYRSLVESNLVRRRSLAAIPRPPIPFSSQYDDATSPTHPSPYPPPPSSPSPSSPSLFLAVRTFPSQRSSDTLHALPNSSRTLSAASPLRVQDMSCKRCRGYGSGHERAKTLMRGGKEVEREMGVKGRRLGGRWGIGAETG